MANIYNTDGTINSSAVQELLTAVGYLSHPTDTGTYTAHNIAGRTSNNSGATIIFPMGYYVSKAGVMDTSKPIYWQAVYLRNGYLTIWMNNNYTVDYFNYKTISSSGWGNGTSHNSSNYSNYSRSTLRDITNNIYTALSGKLTNFSDIIKSPSVADATWQKTQTEDIYTYRDSSSSTSNSKIDNYYYYAHHNGLDSYSGRYTGWAQNLWNTSDTPYNDEFWIPSYYEVFNKISHATTTTGYIIGQDSLWGLTDADRGLKSTNSGETAGELQTPIDGGNIINYCWLRSGYSYNNNYADQVSSSGFAGGNNVDSSSGVRPAAHLSLSAILEAITSTVTLEHQNGIGGTSSVTANYGSAMPTITPPTREHYTFSGYFTGTNGTGTKYYNADGTSARNWDKTGDTTLYAYWTINKYKIVLNSNNSNYGSILNSGGAIDYGSTYITAAAPKANCAFLYWLDSSAPNTPIYQNPLTIIVTSDKTYTAYFTNSLVDGVVCVATAGGEVRMVGYNAGDTEVTFMAVAYAGYKFDGWFVQGESTALSTDYSCKLSMSAIDGKVVVARFSEISAHINDDTDTPDSGGIV